MEISGWCVKCKAKKEITNGTESKTSRGVRILKGKCGTCGTTVCRMLGK